MKVKTATGLTRAYMRLCGFKGWTSFWNTVYVMPGWEQHQPLLRHEAKHLEQIERASLRAAELCKQMLAYSGGGTFVAELHRISKQSGAYDYRAAGEEHLVGTEDTAIAETVFAAWRKLRLQWQLGNSGRDTDSKK